MPADQGMRRLLLLGMKCFDNSDVHALASARGAEVSLCQAEASETKCIRVLPTATCRRKKDPFIQQIHASRRGGFLMDFLSWVYAPA